MKRLVLLSSHLARPALLLLLAVVSSWSGATECDGRYFAPQDNDNTRALRRPHPEFASLLRGAQNGKAADLRSLAVAYEAGYLVSQCAEKAAYWHRKAALAGDDMSRQWVQARDELDRLAGGPECLGGHCARDGHAPRLAVFYAGSYGHYFAPVSINGVTATGLIDTGASDIAMSEDAARRFGIQGLAGEQVTSTTANGQLTTRRVLVGTVTVGGIALPDVHVAIGISGPMLIGMSFLRRLNLRMDAGILVISDAH